jgi:hypothetical protein
MEIKTLDDQLQLIDMAFSEARNHDKPIGIDGLPYFRQSNRWWDSEGDQEKTVAQFTDVHSADDEPLAVAALVAHVKDRVLMSITSDTNSVLLRIIIKFETRRNATADATAVVKDRYLVEFQWVMPLPDIQIPDIEPSLLDGVPSFVPTPAAATPPDISMADPADDEII